MRRLYNQKSVCVLVSGGLDSAVLAGDLARRGARVYPVYIRQGLAWESVEMYWLRRYLRALRTHPVQPLQVFSLPMKDVYGSHWSLGRKGVPGVHSPDKAVYLPGRNLVLLVKAAIYCAQKGLSRLALGSLDHNPFPDATPRFFKQWSKTLQLGLNSRLVIETPYRHRSKVDVLKLGQGLPLELSFSCLAPVGKKHCGRCNKCAERRKAFRKAGVPDKTLYAKR